MTITEIDNLIEEGQSLKTIAQAYSEIANIKLKKIRAEVQRNRIFFQEISRVYGLVRALAQKNKISTVKPRKRLCIVLTSNLRFYGNINAKLLTFFSSFISELDTDVILLGKAAIEHFEGKDTLKNPTQIVLKSDLPSGEELSGLVNVIKDYNQVLVFHSRLKTLLLQQPVFTDITASSDTVLTAEESQFRFIFEPELKKILQFFDSQILTLLLEATFLESEVSRTASRFISMDQAETEANKFIRENIRLKSYTKRSLLNNQLLESIASIEAIRRKI